MLRIKLEEDLLEKAGNAHYEAILSYVKSKGKGYQEELYSLITKVMPYTKDFQACIDSNDWHWLYAFIISCRADRIVME